jgi:hypothetical protein
VGDFDGDGKQDHAITNNDSNNVSILLGNGTGGFDPAKNFAAGVIGIIIRSPIRWFAFSTAGAFGTLRAVQISPEGARQRNGKCTA